MSYWYVAQLDKSLSIQISQHPDGSYGIGGYLRLYEIEEIGDQGTLICTIYLTGASEVPRNGTGAWSESGSSSGESSNSEVQVVAPDNARRGTRARALAALESDRDSDPAGDLVEQVFAELESGQESVQGQETEETNESNQA